MSDDDLPKAGEDAVTGEPEDGPGADEGYEVGYGRPPIHGRFKPGHSGNVKGRPKGRRNAKTIGAHVLRRKVTVRENGKLRRMEKFEAMLEANAAKAMKGDPRAFAQVMSFMARTGLLTEDTGQASAQPLPEDDAAIIENFLRRKSGNDSDGSNDPETC